MKLWSYLFLPKDISAFERSYLRRMNRVALIFFYLHVPVFIGVAALAGTSPLQAAIMTPIVLIGPTLVYFWFQNPRALSVAYGFTAMVMGGLLVHFGQGPMQIEMHFYFFVLIALLAVFGNPAAVLTAAATVAVHHLVVWLVLPTSVFNYDASLWTVVVHAVFVVLESVAAVFVARSFFDNVIGLEKIVLVRTRELDQRARDMALVLENVGQGFVTIAADGTMSAERSIILARWLGEPPASNKLADYLTASDGRVGLAFELAAAAVFEGVLPLELTLEQLPQQLAVDGRQLQLAYRPIGGGDIPDSLLVVVSDVTAEHAREAAESARREVMAVFERLAADRGGFLEFCDEAADLVRQISAPRTPDAELRRQLHTLKGNAAIFGIESIAHYCHELENCMLEDDAAPTPDQRDELRLRWRTFAGKLATLLGARDVRHVEVADDDIQRVLAALRSNAPAAAIARMIHDWRLEPIALRFERAAEQARRLAQRLGKTLEVEIDDHALRLDPQRWTPFWSTFVHAVRNAIDHGIETAAERGAAGKTPAGHITFGSVIEHGVLRIEIRDDGRGVSWDRVHERAALLGLPCGTPDELTEALFADGMSTKREVTDLSGRGVGLSALRTATARAGGVLTILSEPQRGTSVRFDFVLDAVSDLERVADRRLSQPIQVLLP